MLWMYVGFLALVLLLLALDLGVFHRTAHVVSVQEALGWSAFWIGLGLAFTMFIYVGYERHWLGLGLTPDLMTVAPETATEASAEVVVATAFLFFLAECGSYRSKLTQMDLCFRASLFDSGGEHALRHRQEFQKSLARLLGVT